MLAGSPPLPHAELDGRGSIAERTRSRLPTHLGVFKVGCVARRLSGCAAKPRSMFSPSAAEGRSIPEEGHPPPPADHQKRSGATRRPPRWLFSGGMCRSAVRRSGGDLRLLVQLQDGLPVLAGADANRLLHRQHEDLAVADLARAGVPEDRLDDHVLVFVLDHHLELDLGPDVDRQGRAAVALDDAFLATRALGLDDREGREALVEQLAPDRLERLVANVRLYLFHALIPPRTRWPSGC